MRAPRRSAPTLAARIVRANLLVAAVTALSLAAAGALVASLVWQARETRRVNDSADALVAAFESEAREDHPDLGDAAHDIFQDGAAPGYRVEVWRGGTLVAANQPGATVGTAAGSPAARGWIVASRPLEEGALVVVAIHREHGRRALAVFLVSLAAAAPFCFVLAGWVGRRVAKAVTRPIEEFRDRVLSAQPGGDFPRSHESDPPLEVSDLDAAFHESWQRLAAALAREREFAANASHELRMPLTRIQLHVERAAGKEGAERDRELAEASREVGRTVRLVESLLVLARDTGGGVPAETVNLADVTRQVARRVFPEAGVVVEAPDEAMVRGDEDLLAIAVETLLDNGRKFSADGRDVVVVLSQCPGTVALEVTSPGARIAMADRERLFERFYRGAEARASVNGHGLGLSLCRHIARLHGGDARCTSAPDEDARFVLDLSAWRARTPLAGPGAGAGGRTVRSVAAAVETVEPRNERE